MELVLRRRTSSSAPNVSGLPRPRSHVASRPKRSTMITLGQLKLRLQSFCRHGLRNSHSHQLAKIPRAPAGRRALGNLAKPISTLPSSCCGPWQPCQTTSLAAPGLPRAAPSVRNAARLLFSGGPRKTRVECPLCATPSNDFRLRISAGALPYGKGQSRHCSASDAAHAENLSTQKLALSNG